LTLAGIPVHGALTEGRQVSRRQTDNLPPHVKGRAYFQDLPHSAGGRPNQNTGYWIDILDTDSQKTGELPLEFVTTDEQGDSWAILQYGNGSWHVIEDNLISRTNQDLGWWNINDPQHPDYILPVITHALAVVTAAAAVVPAPAFIAPAPAPVPAPAPARMAAQANGALRGSPPSIFDGDRTKSSDFLLAFRIYRFNNRGHEAITNPATRTTTALSYIAGPLVEAWKEEQLTLLERNIANNIAEGDEAHWTTFETNFKSAFTNTNKKNDAYRELTALKHKDDLDTFIARFKQLVSAAELEADSHGVIEIFKQGLKQALIQNVLTAPDYDPNGTYTFAQMEKRVRDSHLRWINSLAYKNQKQDQKQCFYANLGIKPRPAGQPFKGGRRTTSQGGDAMDVDATVFTQISEEEKKDLTAKNACFYCQKPGHRANDCYKKKRDRAQVGGSGGQANVKTTDTETKIADLIDFSALTVEQIAGALQSETFLKLDDDAKMNVIGKIAPPGF